jgi:HD-like signal output (HDOD) protein
MQGAQGLVPSRAPHGSTGFTAWLRSGAWARTLDTAMPMLPTMAHDVVRLALDPDVSATRITTVVTKDPVLATRVLHLANSAFSSPGSDITTINDAIVRMGTTAVRNVVTAAGLTSRLADPKVYGARGRDLMDHSIGTAYLAGLVADRGGELADEAFLYGLLHDIGKLLVLKLAHDFKVGGRAVLSENEVNACLAEKHAEFGGVLVTLWKLPVHLRDPLVWHHDPSRATDHPGAAAVAYVANRLAHRYGFGCPIEEFDPLADPIFIKMDIGEAVLGQLDARAPGLFEIARAVTG